MHDGCLGCNQPSPVLLESNPDRMTHLIWRLTDYLKLYAIQLQDYFQDVLAM